MSLLLEGVVEEGRIKFDPGVTLPEHARVFVVIPEAPALPVVTRVRLPSPRLVNREDAADFRVTMTVLPDVSI
jgi:hypothetical protein